MSTTYMSGRDAGPGRDSKEEEDLVWEILPMAMNNDLMSIAKAAGMQAAFDIMLSLGGSTIYVPCVEDIQRRLRDARIQREYTGGARVKDLSRRYGLTVRTIYKVIKSQAKEG